MDTNANQEHPAGTSGKATAQASAHLGSAATGEERKGVQKTTKRKKARGHTVHLSGPGLNDFFAEGMVDSLGPHKARENCCGPMLEAVERVIARRAAIAKAGA